MVPSDLDLTALVDFVVNAYPWVPLARVGCSFAKLAKATKTHQIVPVSMATVAELRVLIKREQLLNISNLDLAILPVR